MTRYRFTFHREPCDWFELEASSPHIVSALGLLIDPLGGSVRSTEGVD